MLDIVCSCPFHYHEREVIHNLENFNSLMLTSSLNCLICFVNLTEYKHLIKISCFRSKFTCFDFHLLYARLYQFFKIFLTICGQMLMRIIFFIWLLKAAVYGSDVELTNDWMHEYITYVLIISLETMQFASNLLIFDASNSFLCSSTCT